MIRTFDPLLPKQIPFKTGVLSEFQRRANHRNSSPPKRLDRQCLGAGEDMGRLVPSRSLLTHHNPTGLQSKWRTGGELLAARGPISRLVSAARPVSPLGDGTRWGFRGEGHLVGDAIAADQGAFSRSIEVQS